MSRNSQHLRSHLTLALLVHISQSDAACFLPVMFVQSNLPLSVWCGTLYDARHASVMWLQTADAESPEGSFYFPRLTSPRLMLLGGLLSNHRSTKLPGKVANPCARPASCRFPPLPKRTGVSHNYFCATNITGHPDTRQEEGKK